MRLLFQKYADNRFRVTLDKDSGVLGDKEVAIRFGERVHCIFPYHCNREVRDKVAMSVVGLFLMIQLMHLNTIETWLRCRIEFDILDIFGLW